MKIAFLASFLLFSVTSVLGYSNHRLFLRPNNKTREEIVPQEAEDAAVVDDTLAYGRELQQTCESCGDGVVGNGICKDSSECCSTWGWCGTTSAHCGTSGTCGGGSVGNGICSSPTLCCSEYGYCGTTSDHCRCSGGGMSPTPAPPTPAPPTNPGTCSSPRCGQDWFDANSKCGTPCTSDAQCTVAGKECYGDVSLSLPCCGSAPVTQPPPPPSTDNARLIAYVTNWQQCPTMAEIDKYTHIMVAFAVSYTLNGSNRQCNTDCSIPEPPTCGGAVRKDLISEWKAAGKKVLLSFGGAYMGGSWLPHPDGCWEYCYNNGPNVIERLTELVIDHGYDGVDIDYEYYYDSKNDFPMGSEARNFLTEITTGLKDNLPAESNIVTHAPMDSDVVHGTGYYTILKSLAQAGKLDFLMPQYYNGVAFPVADFAGSTLPHYTNLVNDMFGGDAKRVVFGFCLAECGQYNTNGAEAATIMFQVRESFPCNGGAFFWEFMDDMPGNAWSSPVKNELQAQWCP